MIKYSLSILIALITACSSEVPHNQDQEIFYNTITAIQKKYDEANDSNNSVLVENIEKQAEESIRKGKEFKEWSATVESISTPTFEDTYEIEAEYKKITFHLSFKKPAIESVISQISKGDEVVFSGKADRESSLTTSGAINNPEYRIYPKTFNIKSKNINITQEEEAKKQKETETEDIKIIPNKIKANECVKKIEKAKKLEVIYDIELNKSEFPTILVGPTFYNLPIDVKQNFAETLNCIFMQGDQSHFIYFNMIDYKSGKTVAEFSLGKIKILN